METEMETPQSTYQLLDDIIWLRPIACHEILLRRVTP